MITKTEQSGYRSDGFSQRESPESNQGNSTPAPVGAGGPVGPYDHLEHAYGAVPDVKSNVGNHYSNHYGNGIGSLNSGSPPSMSQIQADNGNHSPGSMGNGSLNGSQGNGHHQNGGAGIPPSPSPTPSPMHSHHNQHSHSPPAVNHSVNHAVNHHSKEYQTLTTVGPIYQAVQSSLNAYSHTQPNFSVSTIIQRNQPTTAYAKI